MSKHVNLAARLGRALPAAVLRPAPAGAQTLEEARDVLRGEVGDLAAAMQSVVTFSALPDIAAAHHTVA